MALDPQGYLTDDSYSEATKGSFGSQQTPKAGFPGFSTPVSTPGAAPAGTPLRANDAAVYARISGASSKAPGMTADEMRAQNEFDKRQGFQPSHSEDDIARISALTPQPGAPAGPLNPAATAAAGPKNPLDLLSQPPTIAGEALPRPSAAYDALPTGQEVPPGAAEMAGEKAGGAVRAAVQATKNPLPGFEAMNPSYQVPGAQKPLVDIPAIAGRANAAVGRGLAAAGNFFGNLVQQGRGLASGFKAGFAPAGDKTQAGVSNASAAQFQKPTKTNPVPVTPTTPVDNIDKSTEALGRFGVSDDEFNRRKNSFAGQF